MALLLNPANAAFVAFVLRGVAFVTPLLEHNKPSNHGFWHSREPRDFRPKSTKIDLEYPWKLNR